MVKICIRDCFIVDYKNFKKGEIVRDEKDLEKIGDSGNFEDYQSAIVGFTKSPEKEKAVEKKPVKKMPIKKMKKRSKKKIGGEK